MAKFRVCPHLYPDRARSSGDVTRSCIALGMPRNVDRGGDLRYVFELVHAVAIEIDRKDSQPAQLVETGGVKMGIVEVTQEQLYRPVLVRALDFLENFLCRECANFSLLGCKALRNTHEPAGGR